MHTRRRQNRRDWRPVQADIHIIQNEMRTAAPDCVFSILADTTQRSRESFRPVGDIKGAINLLRRVPHVDLHGFKFTIGQDRGFERQNFRLALVLVKDVVEVAKTCFQGHDAAFTQAVNRRIGHLAETLAEIMMQTAILLGQNGQRGVIAHGADGFLAILRHRLDDQLQVFQRPAGRKLPLTQFLTVKAADLFGAGNLTAQIDSIFDPLVEGLGIRQPVFQFAVEIKPALLQIDTDHLAGADPTFAYNLHFINRHHAGFRADNQHVVLRQGIAKRPETITVKPGNNPAAIRRADGGGSIPRFHDRVAIGVKRLVLDRHIFLVAPAFRDQQGFRHRRAATGADQYLEHRIQRGAVGPARLNNRLHIVGAVSERVGNHADFMAFHPVDIAADGIDLAVMREHTERLRQIPSGECIGRIALMIDGKAGNKPLIQ